MADDLCPQKAREQFKEIIDFIKLKTQELMKTKSGRDEIRRTFGCRIEGCEDEEKEGIPPGMFNSPML